MAKITILNGPNLNLLGVRETAIYGKDTLKDIEKLCVEKLKADNQNHLLDFLQSNHEGVLIDAIHDARAGAQGLIINPGAFGHYSIALHDALLTFEKPKIEVHISNVWKREDFRHSSTLSPVVDGVISGLGIHGYILALDYLLKNIHINGN